MTRRMVQMEIAYEYSSASGIVYYPGEVQSIDYDHLRRKDEAIVVARTGNTNKVELFEITAYENTPATGTVYCSYDQLIREMEVLS